MTPQHTRDLLHPPGLGLPWRQTPGASHLMTRVSATSQSGEPSTVTHLFTGLGGGENKTSCINIAVLKSGDGFY